MGKKHSSVDTSVCVFFCCLAGDDCHLCRTLFTAVITVYTGRAGQSCAGLLAQGSSATKTGDLQL